MKIVKRTLSLLACLALVCTCVMALAQTSSQNLSGGRSSVVATLTEEDEQWILERFGHCDDLEELLICIRDYCTTNFHYDYEKAKVFYFQHFNFRDLVESKKGICFDFSCFTKACIVVCKEKNPQLGEPKVYEVSVRFKDNYFMPGHSYNIIQTANANYYLDVTTAIYNVQVKRKPAKAMEVFYEDIEEYVKRYNEILLYLR